MPVKSTALQVGAEYAIQAFLRQRFGQRREGNWAPGDDGRTDHLQCAAAAHDRDVVVLHDRACRIGEARPRRRSAVVRRSVLRDRAERQGPGSRHATRVRTCAGAEQGLCRDADRCVCGHRGGVDLDQPGAGAEVHLRLD